MSSLLSEIRRRRVLRELGVYAVISWLLLQILDVLANPLGLPPWYATALIYVLMVGFFVTIVFAWRYDFTAHGIVKTATLSSDVDATPISRSDYFVVIALTIVVIGAGYGVVSELGGDELEYSATSDVDLPRNGIAVLPFLNLSNDPDNDYFSDGLADTVLHMLTQIPQLKVTARASSFLFKGKNEDMRVIGRALNVGNILEGSVQFAGNRIRVIAQLIDASDGSHTWSKTFDRQADDVFSIQDEIAAEVADALEITLSGSDPQVLTHGTTNIEAYREYLLGLHQYQLNTTETRRLSVQHFERAIELDPNYVMGYVGFADLVPKVDSYKPDQPRIVKDLLDTAMALEPDSADVHASMGDYMSWTGRTEDAEHHWKRAIELNPNLAKTYHLYASHLVGKRPEEAVVFARKGVALDPLSIDTLTSLGRSLSMIGDLEGAKEQFQRILQIHPDHPRAYDQMGSVYVDRGQIDQAIRYVRRASEMDPGEPWMHLHAGYLYAMLADFDSAQVLLDEAWRLEPRDFGAKMFQFDLHMERGEFSEAEVLVNEMMSTNPWWWPRVMASSLYAELGRYDEALEQVEMAWSSTNWLDLEAIDRQTVYQAVWYAYLLQKTGGPEEKIDQLITRALVITQSLPRYMFGTTDVLIYVIRGENERAVDSLRLAIDEGMRWELTLLEPKWSDDRFAPLRGDARFEGMLQELRDDIGRMRKSIEKRPDLDESDLALATT